MTGLPENIQELVSQSSYGGKVEFDVAYTGQSFGEERTRHFVAENGQITSYGDWKSSDSLNWDQARLSTPLKPYAPPAGDNLNDAIIFDDSHRGKLQGEPTRIPSTQYKMIEALEQGTMQGGMLLTMPKNPEKAGEDAKTLRYFIDDKGVVYGVQQTEDLSNQSKPIDVFIPQHGQDGKPLSRKELAEMLKAADRVEEVNLNQQHEAYQAWEKRKITQPDVPQREAQETVQNAKASFAERLAGVATDLEAVGTAAESVVKIIGASKDGDALTKAAACMSALAVVLTTGAQLYANHKEQIDQWCDTAKEKMKKAGESIRDTAEKVRQNVGEYADRLSHDIQTKVTEAVEYVASTIDGRIPLIRGASVPEPGGSVLPDDVISSPPVEATNAAVLAEQTEEPFMAVANDTVGAPNLEGTVIGG